MQNSESGMETVEWAIVAGLLVSGLVLVVVALGPLILRAYMHVMRNVGA